MDMTSGGSTPKSTDSTTRQPQTTRTILTSAEVIELDMQAYLREVARLPSRHPVAGDLGAIPP